MTRWTSGLLAMLASSTAMAAPWTSDLEAPPVMRPGALIVDNVCPEDARWPTAAQAAGRDVKVTLPRDRVCQPPKVSGGQIISMLGGTPENPAKNVHVVGGEIVNIHPQGPLTGVRGQALLRIHNIAEGSTVLIEGVKFDARATCQDIINSLALKPNVKIVLQNIYAEGAGTCGSGGTHGDVFHAQGSGAQHELKIQNLTAKVLGQGIFVPPRPPGDPAGHGVHTLELDHVHLIADDPKRQPSKKHGIGWGLFWNEGLAGSKPARATFKEVYLDGHFPYASKPAANGFHNDCAILPAGAATGTWCKGTPKKGSPVRPDMVGRNYQRTAFTGSFEPPPPPPLPSPPNDEQVTLQGSGLLVNAGGTGDQWAIGGKTVDRGPIEIFGAPGREGLYRTERYGMSGYHIPLVRGTYDVHLRFAETWFTTANRRPMDITVGEIKLPTFDVFADAGAGKTAHAKRVLGVKVGDAGLPITWANTANSMINAIEVTLPGVLVEEDTPPPPPPPPPPPGKGDCALPVPPQAAAAGLTKLAFCDDFSKDSVARGSTIESRKITGEKKWTTERATVFWTEPDPADNFRFNADGTLTVQPKYGTFNWFMSSTFNDRNGKLLGFWLKKEPKWFAEIRWKFEKGSAGPRQPGFWSMDTCHLYGLPGRCSGPNREYIEPDFWEYAVQNSMATHLHAETPNGQPQGESNPQHQMSCSPGYAGPRVGDNQWNVMGHAYLGNEIRYTLNDAVYWTRKPQDGCYKPKNSQWRGPMNAGYVLDAMKNGDYPILIGSKPGEIITIDYVRVWTAP